MKLPQEESDRLGCRLNDDWIGLLRQKMLIRDRVVDVLLDVIESLLEGRRYDVGVWLETLLASAEEVEGEGDAMVKRIRRVVTTLGETTGDVNWAGARFEERTGLPGNKWKRLVRLRDMVEGWEDSDEEAALGLDGRKKE